MSLQLIILKKYSETVIQHFKSIFAKFGIPQIVVSDNGPEFASDVFNQFSRDWGFDHQPSSPEYPLLNGMVERIQTVKQTLKKAFASNQDPYLTFLALRTTSFQDKSSSAFQLMNRNLRTTLPRISHRQRMKPNTDDSSKHDLPELKPGDSVRVRFERNPSKWSVKEKVLRKLSQPRSYLVITEKGKRSWRNRCHLLKPMKSFSSILSISIMTTIPAATPVTQNKKGQVVPPGRFQ